MCESILTCQRFDQTTILCVQFWGGEAVCGGIPILDGSRSVKRRAV